MAFSFFVTTFTFSSPRVTLLEGEVKRSVTFPFSWLLLLSSTGTLFEGGCYSPCDFFFKGCD